MEIYRAAELIGKAEGEFEKLNPLVKMQAGAVMRPLIASVRALLQELENVKQEGKK